jgi:hypothetical protein
MSKIYEFMTADEKAEVDAIVARAVERKKNAPKAERTPRGPMTQEQKDTRNTKEYNKLAEKLAAMRAGK